MLKFALLTDTAKLPTRKNWTDAGIDLYADLLHHNKNYIEVYPNDYEIIPTGVTVEIPPGYFGWITNKSRNNFLIGGGIIDQGYQGELLVKDINPLDDIMVIEHGYGVAQLIIVPTLLLDVEIVDIRDIHKVKTDRGNTGGIVDQLRPQYSVDQSDFGIGYDDDK